MHAHGRGQDDGLVRVGPVLERVGSIAELVQAKAVEGEFAALRAAEGTGRPVGAPDFVADLERRLGRPLARRAARRKPTAVAAMQPALF